MKTTFKLILVAVCVTFFSCQKDVNLSSDGSSITSDGVISGKIINYVPNSIDSVKARGVDVVGIGKVSPTGEFSIRLIIPQLSMIGSLKGVAVSDTTAMGGGVTVSSYLNNKLNGELKKCNTDSLNKAGAVTSMFIYVDRTFTMKGTHVELSPSNSMTVTATSVYNITFKKGWNEVTTKITTYTATANSLTLSMSLTNIITSDLQWHFIESYYSGIHGELDKMKAANVFLFK